MQGINLNPVNADRTTLRNSSDFSSTILIKEFCFSLGMDTEEKLITALRKNARASLTPLAKEFDTPQSTLYALLGKLEKGVIKRHTSLLNFHDLGYHTHAMLLISTSRAQRSEIETHLRSASCVNSFWRILGNHDYLAEVLFLDEGELKSFVEDIEENNKRTRCRVLHVLEEKKKEEFMTCQKSPIGY